MTLEHLLLWAIGAPAAAGILAAAALCCARRGGRWPAWSALLLGAALTAVGALHPNFGLRSPWSSAEAALPWAPLLWALGSSLPGRAALAGSAAAAAFFAWRTFTDVAEYYGWSPAQHAGLVLLATVAGLASAWLARTAARQHPAPAMLGAWTVIVAAASVVLLFGRTAKGAEFAGLAAASLTPAALLAFTRGRADDASAWAATVVGTMHAVLLFGLLQAEALWISVVMLVLLAPAAGLITLRNPRALPRAAGLAFVTLLPAAAAVVLAWFRAELRPQSGLPY